MVFKVERDAAGSKHVHAHLRGGTLRVRDRVDLRHGPAEKVTALQVYDGADLRPTTAATAGQVVVMRGLDSARIGDTFGTGPASHVEAQFARPSLATVVEPRVEADRGRLHTALSRLAEQDPLIDLRQDDVRRELQLSLYGEVQKEVIGALLEEEYGVAASFRESTVICVERVRGRAPRPR